MNFLRPLALILIGVIVSLAGIFISTSLYDRDTQGEANSSCEKFDGPSSANGRGMTASSHTTACTTVGTSVVTYVYLHPSGQPPTAKHLVFRFSQSGDGDSLRFEWVNEQLIVVRVDHVSYISKIQTQADAILIRYNIGGN